MRPLILLAFSLGAFDPLTGGDADAMRGCDTCHPKPRPKAKADVPENLPMPPPSLELVETKHVAPLSNVPSEHLAKMHGTDLGVSFVRDGQIVFLFGDSTPDSPSSQAPCCDDSVAVTPDTAFKDRQPIDFVTRSDGHFLTLGAPGRDLGGMEVPVEGVADGPDTYVFFSDDWGDDTERHDSLVLAKTKGLDFAHMQTLWVEPSERFINLSIVEDSGEYFIFGSGSYRKSAVYLARVAKAKLADKSAWRYWRREPSGAVSYVSDEMGASQIVPDSCVGEMSVRYEPKLQLYLMAYNCGAPRGIVLRSSPEIEGPWSQPIVMFDPALHGYGKFMHVPVAVAGFDDHLGDAMMGDVWGGEYGGYMVPSWTQVEWNGDVSIYYAVSSWNPYQAHIVKSTLRKK